MNRRLLVKTHLLLAATLLTLLALLTGARQGNAVPRCDPPGPTGLCTTYYSDAAKTHPVCTDCCGSTDCVPTPYYKNSVGCC
jgi:hypothetical protein